MRFWKTSGFVCKPLVLEKNPRFGFARYGLYRSLTFWGSTWERSKARASGCSWTDSEKKYDSLQSIKTLVTDFI